MLEDEQAKLLSLFSEEQRWCQNAEACDRNGSPVRYGDADAVSWDITGAVCRLFGWGRGSVLFDQMYRHVTGAPIKTRYNQDPHIASMTALQSYNDREDMTFDELIEKLRTMPVRAERMLR